TDMGFGTGPRAELDPRVRGRIVHSLLEQADFARPIPPDAVAVRATAEQAGAHLAGAAAQEIADLISGFRASDLCARLAGLEDLRREQPFSLSLDQVPLVGVFDAIGREGKRTLVVDYKSDRL